ncbi:MAG: ribonuclease H-like domain-containing protein [Planctomycetota bacterium]|jgi:uncharacterized protein YprB with RNaseH-like and TPR domain
MKRRAYLDIETTGLSRDYYDITVIGIAFENRKRCKVVQLVGDAVSDVRLLESLSGADEIYTYNGSRFDLPFIRKKLHVDLSKMFSHRDLMYDCWKQNLKGGLKVVEEKLEIGRNSKGIDGFMAVRLWWNYISNNDQNALKTLLEYNKEDTINLKILREKLGVD